MRKITLLGIAIFLSFFLYAQEVQISFCNGSLTIDSNSAKKISILKDIEGFIDANLFELNDTSKILEVRYAKDGTIYRRKITVTNSDLNVICDELMVQSTRTKPDEVDFGKMGRKRLVSSSMLTSLGYYGWAIPMALNAENEEAYTASYMIIGSAGFFIPFMATRNKEVSLGMAKGYRSGSLLGIAHGWALAGVLMGDDIEPNFTFGISTLTSIGEGLLGYSIAKRNDWSYNRVSCISLGGYWGLGEGLALSYVLNFNDVRLTALTTMGVSGIGMYGGYIAGDKYKLSNGSLTVINTLGILGAYIPVGIISLTDLNLNRGVVALIAASSMMGLGYGIYHTNGVNYSRQQGNVVGLGTFAGGLAGAGIMALTESESIILPTIGALCGFIVTDRLIRKEIGKENGKNGLTMNLDFNPFPLMLTRQDFKRNLMNQYTAEANYLVRLRMTF